MPRGVEIEALAEIHDTREKFPNFSDDDFDPAAITEATTTQSEADERNTDIMTDYLRPDWIFEPIMVVQSVYLLRCTSHTICPSMVR